MTDRPKLDSAIAAVAASTGGAGDLRDTLMQVTDLAHSTVAGVDFASVTIRHTSGRLETVAPSSPLMYIADGLQYEINEGPCYDAVTDDIVMYCADLAHDSRWPNFGPRASTLGLASLLAVRLVHPGVTLLALNLYADTIGAFAQHEKVAELFTHQTDRNHGAAGGELELQMDPSSQITVDQATGILMHRHGLDAKSALQLLRELAEHRSRSQGPRPRSGGAGGSAD